MSARPDAVRRHARALAGLAVAGALYLAARLPALSQAEEGALAARYRFTPIELATPAGEVQVDRHVRAVHPSLEHIAGWISVLGGAAALCDLDGDGAANDVLHVDTRTERVVALPAPGTGERYAPFALHPLPGEPFDATAAPMGALPGDFDEDGLTDVLVYYWGRTPRLFLRRAGSAAPAPGAYEASELVRPPERWYTNALCQTDLDGDGHLDLVVGNYFPDGARILDAAAGGVEHMHDSMSRALNGGRNRILAWRGASPGLAARFEELDGALDARRAQAWTLAVGACDLDGDLRPELYFANDFGHDLLLHNRTRDGRVELAPLAGRRTVGTPASKVLGRDSFKGMGVDFGDIDGDGRFDLYVSNITTEYGLMESQLLFVATGEEERMADGIAPFSDESEALLLARSGWAWDARLADFDGDGVPEALQALGFLRGTRNRWPELHEVAMGNDQLLASPGIWHRFADGDDLSGSAPPAFFARGPDGRYHAVGARAGLSRDQNTRGIAIGDVDRDGDLDAVLGNQWEPSVLLRNDARQAGAFLGLDLRAAPDLEGDAVVRAEPGARAGRTWPAVGAVARLSRADGRRAVAQVDGGAGHSGKRAPEVLLAVPHTADEVEVEVRWRDAAPEPHVARLRLAPGWHTLLLPWSGGRP